MTKKGVMLISSDETITLAGDDAALIIRKSGEMEMYLPSLGPGEPSPDNLMLIAGCGMWAHRNEANIAEVIDDAIAKMLGGGQEDAHD